MKKIAIIQGHPDPNGRHLGHALAQAYATGAQEAGHETQRIEVAALEFPWLQTKQQFETGPVPPALQAAQDAIAWADHLVVLYPLWLGTMPALLKAFFEQVFRPGFAFTLGGSGRGWNKRLVNKSARVVVTMGMPALLYRWYFGAHSLKSLERNILGFTGISPIRESLFGMVDTASDAKRQKWLDSMHRLGQEAQ
jgi:putative NADPH-quinone reductase